VGVDRTRLEIWRVIPDIREEAITRLVQDAELREHYRKARMLMFPQVEDFGIVAVEAQACGLPVVARKAAVYP
jgi:glycosyltransferase involved in cell wall biosynthesis